MSKNYDDGWYNWQLLVIKDAGEQNGREMSQREQGAFNTK